MTPLNADEQARLRAWAEAVVLARRGGAPVPAVPDDVASIDGEGGAFVRVLRGDEVLGFFGTLGPSPWGEAVATAAAAALDEDLRAVGDTDGELTVDLWCTGPATPLADLEALDPKRRGVALTRGWQRGVLLPGLHPELEAAPAVWLESLCIGAGVHPDAWQDDDAELTVFDCLVVAR